jgi:hypothetical protein
VTGALAIGSVRERKRLLLERARFCEQWERLFPGHDLSTLRRHSFDLDGFYETIERLAKENKARRAKQQVARRALGASERATANTTEHDRGNPPLHPGARRRGAE